MAVTSVPMTGTLEETGAYWTGGIIIVLLPANGTSYHEAKLVTASRRNIHRHAYRDFTCR